MTGPAVYAGLFAVAFFAATLLPAQSEAMLVGLLLSGTHSPTLLIVTASLGNIAGSVVNWLLGRGIDSLRHRRWFPVGEPALQRAQAWYRRLGRWSLLLSWLPIVGDPLTVAAGVMRERFVVFVLLVGIAKTGRYLALAAVVRGWL